MKIAADQVWEAREKNDLRPDFVRVEKVSDTGKTVRVSACLRTGMRFPMTEVRDVRAWRLLRDYHLRERQPFHHQGGGQ